MNKNNCYALIFSIKIKNNYVKILLSMTRRIDILLKVKNLGKRIIHISTQQYKKLYVHKVIKLSFVITLVICLLFGQVVTAQIPNTNALVEQGIKDYNSGNFSKAIARVYRYSRNTRKSRNSRKIIKKLPTIDGWGRVDSVGVLYLAENWMLKNFCDR
jgi:hypothetical protein